MFIKRRGVLFGLVTCFTLAGCQTPAQMLDSMQPQAISAAQSRAQFEMNCTQLISGILSRELIPPVIVAGDERAEYTIGFKGCSQRKTYVVVCDLETENCFAGAGH